MIAMQMTRDVRIEDATPKKEFTASVPPNVSKAMSEVDCKSETDIRGASRARVSAKESDDTLPSPQDARDTISGPTRAGKKISPSVRSVSSTGNRRALRRLIRKRVSVLSDVFGDVDVAVILVRNAMGKRSDCTKWIDGYLRCVKIGICGRFTNEGRGCRSAPTCDSSDFTAVLPVLNRQLLQNVPTPVDPSVDAPRPTEPPTVAPEAPSTSLPTRPKTAAELLSALEEPSKVSTIAASNANWEIFKTSQEGLDEQLRQKAEGKDAFLLKKEFLQRCDLRQFETERDGRTAKRQADSK